MSFETGLTYSYLHTVLESGSATYDAHWHYLGIPIRLSFSNFTLGRFRFYATAGAQVDIPLYSDVSSGFRGASLLAEGSFRAHTVWSLNAGYGVCFRISNSVGIVIEPTLRYNFTHKFEVPNLWTDNRWTFSLPIGFQLKF